MSIFGKSKCLICVSVSFSFMLAKQNNFLCIFRKVKKMKRETIQSLLKQLKTKGKMTPKQLLGHEELILEAIEKARKQILSQTVLIKGLTKRVKGLTKRVEELEDRAEYVDDDLDCIHRALEAA